MNAFDCSNKSGYMHKQNRFNVWSPEPILFTVEVCVELTYMNTNTKSESHTTIIHSHAYYIAAFVHMHPVIFVTARVLSLCAGYGVGVQKAI